MSHGPCDPAATADANPGVKLWRKEQWCIPPEANAEFVCAMEDVLEVYQRPYDETHPLVTMDESSKQLVKEVRTPLPGQPGEPEK
jgi:hypothetical protein